MYVMLTFLEVNGVRPQCTDEEIVHAGLSLADIIYLFPWRIRVVVRSISPNRQSISSLVES